MQRAGNQPVRVLQAARPSIIISFYKNEQMLWNLVGLDQLCYERHLSPNRVKFLSEERGGCYGVTRLPVGTCRGGRQRGGGDTLLIIWRIVASAGFCGHLLSYTRSLCQEIVKADKYSLFCKWWLRRINVLPTAAWKGGHTWAPAVWGKLFYICIYDSEKHIWKKIRVKTFR